MAKNKKQEVQEENYMTMGMSLGMCFGLTGGIVVGSFINNIGVCLCFGLGIGMCFGMAIGSSIKKDKKNKK